MTFNSYSNAETWLVACWLKQDELAPRVARLASQAVTHSASMTCATIALCDRIAIMLDDYLPELDEKLAADLLGAAVSRVELREIAAPYVSYLWKNPEAMQR